MTGAAIPVRLTIDGADMAQDRVCFNGGMNFGQFERREIAEGSVGLFQMTFSRKEFVAGFDAAYNDICEEMRIDDKGDPEPSPFAYVDHGPLNRALDNTDAAFEIIEGFLLRDHIFPQTVSLDFRRIILNSFDNLRIGPETVTLSGRYRTAR